MGYKLASSEVKDFSSVELETATFLKRIRMGLFFIFDILVNLRKRSSTAVNCGKPK